MSLSDFHVHTSFCDGVGEPEEYVSVAIKRKLTAIGFSAHSFVPFDPNSCIAPDRIGEYYLEIHRLREKYRGVIDIFLGIEADLYSPQNLDGLDYVIGSVHYLRCGDSYMSVDETPEVLMNIIDRFYCGDFYACSENYFATVAEWAKKRPTVIGHFDLIKKFKNSGVPFDENDKRYVNAWKNAADSLITNHAVFEINTGGISRGYLAEPYPSPVIISYIADHGGKFILSSDSHRPDTICYGFQQASKLISEDKTVYLPDIITSYGSHKN